jgi:hypothetical protein
MKTNTTTILLLAAAAAGGYYFYNKQKSASKAASKVKVEEDKATKEEDKSSSSYGTPSGYGSSPAYATASAPSLVKTSTSEPKQKLTIIEKLQKAKSLFDRVRTKKNISGFEEMTSSRAYGSNKKHHKNMHHYNMHHKRKANFDHCIGLF